MTRIEEINYQYQFVKNAWLKRDQIYNDLFGSIYTCVSGKYEIPKLLPSLASLIDSNDDSCDESKVEKIIEQNNFSIFDSQELAILCYPCDPFRPYNLYVTSGLSTPWLSVTKEDVSGYAVELAIKSKTEAKWPINLLLNLSLQILNHTGLFSPGATLDLKSSIDQYADSLIDKIFVWYLDEAKDAWYELPSGGFGIFCCIGITKDEMKYLKSQNDYGAWAMQDLLTKANVNQITDPFRKSIMKNKEIKAYLPKLKNYLNNYSEFGVSIVNQASEDINSNN